MKINEKDIDNFIKEGNCKFCGSQRCEQTKEWVEACKKFQEYITNKKR